MSIKQIAEKAGVSPATVSRVLNNPGYKCSSPELRNKIWKIAIEENYVPNEAARSLKLGTAKGDRIYYINVLMTRMDEAQSDPFFTELLHVVESEIHKNSCILSKVWYQSLFSNDRKCRFENLDRLIDTMHADIEEKCDGLVIIGKCNKEVLRRLKQRYKGVVSVNRNSVNCEVDEVLCDGGKIATMAVEYLIQLGHRSIGYVGECHNEVRYHGYLDTLRGHEIDVEPEYIIETKQTEAEGYESMQKILQMEEYPTGIYCANDITAVGMLKCLNKYKNRYYTPSIISSDDIEEAQYTKPMLSTVKLPKEEMGKFAIYLLLDRLRGGHKGSVRMELEGRLIVRNSCYPVADTTWSDYNI
ncbi:MAG: LacI family DNA-binding transcriptional regulator [Lachnospiraceae bacterium]|nr:LacI family DNA-binding transcriptional regulator [Lachnospiraceae bacterium]